MGIPKSRRSTKLTPPPVDESPIRAIFCVKKKKDIRKIEEFEDCFILDFDPSESLDLSSPFVSKNRDVSNDTDLSVVAEKGKVACRDYPHPRHLCVKFPFDKTPHDTHCKMCFCFVCDTTAPCKQWTKGLKHCDATDDSEQIWRLLRGRKRKA